MLIIRLQRHGKQHEPRYRIVVAEKHRSVSKLAQEILGTYNTITKKLIIKNPESLQRHIALNTQISDTLRAILKRNNLLDIAPQKSQKKSTTKKKLSAQSEE